MRLVILSTAIAGRDAEPPVELDAISGAIEHAVSFAEKVTVVPRADVLRSGLDDRLRRCGSDLDCASIELGQERIDRALYVVVNFTSYPWLISMRLVDADSGAELSRALGSCDGCELEALLRSKAAAMLEQGGHVLGGRLNVETAPANAEVQIEPRTSIIGGNQGSLLVLPGEYGIAAALEDHVSTSTRAVVLALSETRVALQLEPETSVFVSPALWIAIGAVAVIGGGIALAVSLRPEDKVIFCPGSSDEACER